MGQNKHESSSLPPHAEEMMAYLPPFSASQEFGLNLSEDKGIRALGRRLLQLFTRSHIPEKQPEIVGQDLNDEWAGAGNTWHEIKDQPG